MAESPRSRGDGLAPEQIAFLIDSGGFTEESFARATAAVARGDLAESERKTAEGAVVASITADVAAARLGVDAAEVERLRGRGDLYAFNSEGVWRYPRWQFIGNAQQHLLPHLAHLVASIPTEMHAATVLGFMRTPQRSAQIDGKPVTPVEWLTRGGDPQVLRELLEAFLWN